MSGLKCSSSKIASATSDRPAPTSPASPSTSNPGIRCPRARRYEMAATDHPSAATSAAAVPDSR